MSTRDRMAKALLFLAMLPTAAWSSLMDARHTEEVNIEQDAAPGASDLDAEILKLKDIAREKLVQSAKLRNQSVELDRDSVNWDNWGDWNINNWGDFCDHDFNNC